MDSNQRAGFEFHISVPVVFPTKEELDHYPALDPWVEKLISSEYINREEAIAYLNFATLSAGIPSMMDEFLAQYRDRRATAPV